MAHVYHAGPKCYCAGEPWERVQDYSVLVAPALIMNRIVRAPQRGSHYDPVSLDRPRIAPHSILDWRVWSTANQA